MQMFKLKSCILKCSLMAMLLGSNALFAFDFNAKYKEVNFLTVEIPACSDESKSIPELPKDERADFYYQVALKILGQNDTEHYKQMYILGDKAAEMGHWKAKLLMANLYLRNSDSQYVEYKPEKAKLYIDELLKENVPAAFYAMGQYKLSGMKGFRENPIPASVYLFEAAKLNNPDALSDMYDIFVSVGRIKDANTLLDCAVEQKQGVAGALLKKANALETEASTEAELIESFQYLYKATKAGSYNAVASFPNKENYYKIQYGKTFFSKGFLDRMKSLENAKNSSYIHRDPYRITKSENNEVRGNSNLLFEELEKVVPFPPTALPSWNGDIGVALSEKDLKNYRTDFNYDELVKEAEAVKVEKPNTPDATKTEKKK